ncbi:hypothetical protein EPA93_10190 [Ktedonosporobacter rubrisoli]|uniref:Uncharacterized protein n=1 Tax=Ktedonosporobacter rubrisoli TaxID=2509675 RepID=A0A4P6JM48_KTERU|nr:hypothetical protein [Ktedonosporobacter rubrisoli]QBD76357.1 hypothetical protein EPA93_10190 [Ktedonosporobacter rubrisoli]
MRDLPLENVLRGLNDVEREWKLYEDEIIRRAQQQAVVELLYNEVLKLYKDCIELMGQLEKGETVSQEWCKRKDALMMRLQEYSI